MPELLKLLEFLEGYRMPHMKRRTGRIDAEVNLQFFAGKKLLFKFFSDKNILNASCQNFIDFLFIRHYFHIRIIPHFLL